MSSPSDFQNYDSLLESLSDAREAQEASVREVAETKAKSDDMAKTLGEAKDAFSVHAIGSAFKKGFTDSAKKSFDTAFQSAKDKLSEIKQGATKSVEDLAEENQNLITQGAERLTQYSAKILDGTTSAFEDGVLPAASSAGAGAGAGAGADAAGISSLGAPLAETEVGVSSSTFATGAAASQAEQVAQSFANATGDLSSATGDLTTLGDLSGSIRVGQMAGNAGNDARALKSAFSDEDIGQPASETAYSTTTGLSAAEEATMSSNTALAAAGGGTGEITEAGLAATRVGSAGSSIAETLNAARAAGGDALETATAGITKDLAVQAGKEAIGESISAGLSAIPGIDILGAVAGIVLAGVMGHKESKELKQEGPMAPTGAGVSGQIGI